jgi:hypothetical protein
VNDEILYNAFMPLDFSQGLHRIKQPPGSIERGKSLPNHFAWRFYAYTHQISRSPKTTIAFSIPQTSFISLKFFDLLGRELATLVNEEMRAGRYERTFEAQNHPSEVHFYKLTSASFSAVKKLILMR